jgi:23S rRNA pseudouridine2605 synthase
MDRARRIPRGKVPLERALSKLGIASRTEARAWIIEGKVEVNGTIRKDPCFAVVPETAKLRIEGRAVGPMERRTLLLNKPRGAITTRRDEKGRRTVFDLLPERERSLHAVGRLDLATTGLLILTNDTSLSSWLTDPSNRVPRVYLVSVRGEVTPEESARMERGIQDEGELLRADQAEIRKSSGRESHLVVTLSGGKNREIRRLLLLCGHEVTRLKRVAYGGLELGELEPGKYREVSDEELRRAFPAYSGLDSRRGHRGSR